MRPLYSYWSIHRSNTYSVGSTAAFNSSAFRRNWLRQSRRFNIIPDTIPRQSIKEVQEDPVIVSYCRLDLFGNI